MIGSECAEANDGGDSEAGAIIWRLYFSGSDRSEGGEQPPNVFDSDHLWPETRRVSASGFASFDSNPPRCVSTFHYVKHCILANFEQTSDLAVEVAVATNALENEM